MLTKAWESSYSRSSVASTQEKDEETFQARVRELRIQNFNLKVINAWVLIPREKKICTWVQEYKSHKRILICFAQATLLMKKQEKQRTQDIKATEKNPGHSVWISPYHCNVWLCLKSPRRASWERAPRSTESADRGCFRLAECEENSDINPAWDWSHKLRRTDSLP